MAQVSYADEDALQSPSLRRYLLARRLVRERNGQLLNLYRMLSHRPSVARAWLRLGTAIRSKGTLPDRLREVVICTVAVSLNSAYEFSHHAPLARSFGIAETQLAALGRSPDLAEFSGPDRAAVIYTRSVVTMVRMETADADLSSSLVQLREHYSEQEIVEITATVSYYVGVAAFVKALDIEFED